MHVFKTWKFYRNIGYVEEHYLSKHSVYFVCFIDRKLYISRPKFQLPLIKTYPLCCKRISQLTPQLYWRSRQPRGLRRGSAVASFLRFGFESRKGNWCSFLVSVVRCLGEVSAADWSLVQRSPTECGVSNECDLEVPWGSAVTRNRIGAPEE